MKAAQRDEMGETVDRNQEPSELLDPLKDAVRNHYDVLATDRAAWYTRNSYYYRYLENRLQQLIPPGSRVLELGCGTGNLLAALKPGVGLGIDLSSAMVAEARRQHPDLAFEVGDAETIQLSLNFDFVVASDLLAELSDISAMLDRLHYVCSDAGKLIVTFHNPALEGSLRVAQRLRLAMAPYRQNWVSPRDARNLLNLSDFEVEVEELGLLVPKNIPLLASTANRTLSRMPGIRYFNLVNLMVARPHRPRPAPRTLTCTVLIPCRNEVDNVLPAVQRVPKMGSHTEILFVDGSSTDGTKERIEEVIDRYHGEKDIKLMLQVPEATYEAHKDDANTPISMLQLGKGDAVRKGFDAATGDVLMILDADLTVPPEDLPRFFAAIATGKADFINGTRLVYPMEEKAMKFANYLGNKFFSILFTWLLEQPIRDTLCGTKVLLKTDYARIKAGRAHFGEFDPFGDFDLLFGAARLGLRIIEVPVRYRRRLAGVSKVRVAQHGWLLIGMSIIGFHKLKLSKWLDQLSRADRPGGKR